MKNERRFYVYEWYKIETDEVFYVGKGTGERYRNKSHRSEYFKRIVSKYDCSVRIIKDNLTEEEAFELEESTILEYKTLGLELANLSNGGKGGSSGTKHSEKYKDKFRGANNPMYGRPWWDENTPQHEIDKWKKKISEGHKGEKNSQFGKPFHERMDEATYEKWLNAHREGALGDKNGRAKKCLMMDLNGEVVKEFGCIKYCVDYLIENNIAHSTNHSTIRGRIKHSIKKNKAYCDYFFKVI